LRRAFPQETIADYPCTRSQLKRCHLKRSAIALIFQSSEHRNNRLNLIRERLNLTKTYSRVSRKAGRAACRSARRSILPRRATALELKRGQRKDHAAPNERGVIVVGEGLAVSHSNRNRSNCCSRTHRASRCCSTVDKNRGRYSRGRRRSGDDDRDHGHDRRAAHTLGRALHSLAP
jgi:hypothetical protein